ncbi:hypothetical protein ACFLWA_07170 [Chloroflexota bacterium]
MARRRSWWLSLILIILLVGCQSERQDDSSMTASGNISQIVDIEDYLVTNVGISAFGGEVFCAYKPLDVVQGVEGKMYLWVLCQEYYLEQESLIPGSGVSLPVAVRIQEKDGHYEIVEHLVPRDGAYYGPDVRATFPESTWSQIMPRGEDGISQYNYRANTLEEETEEKARSYYGIGTP